MNSSLRSSTAHWLAFLLVALVLLGTSLPDALGLALHRTGALKETPGYYVCHKDLELVKAGLTDKAGPTQRLFAITLKTFCGVLPEWIIQGSAPGSVFGSKTGSVDWVPVMIHGSYDYDARSAVELIEAQEPKTKALQANVQCQNNPWVTGKTCELKSLENHTTADASFSYPVSAVLLSPALRKALQQWETQMATGDQLKDWNPGASTPKSQFAILTPNLGLTIPTNASTFQLSLSGPAPPPTTLVKVEWAKLTAGKDPSIEPLVYHYGTPATAPQTLTWSQLPRKVTIQGVFPAGLYAVRAQVQTNPVTAWQFFWIGPPNPQFAKHIPEGTAADARQAELSKLASGKLELSKLQQIILIGGGQSRLVNVSDLLKLKPGLIQPAPPKTPGPQPGPGAPHDTGAA